jgi:hypothetical protein
VSDDLLRAPIVVLGAPRSGTTFLAALIGSHPDCVEAREARLVWRYGNDSRSDELRPVHATPAVVSHIRGSFTEIVREGGGTRLVEKTPANSVRPEFVDVVFPDAKYVHITRNGWGCVPSIRNFWTKRGQGFDAKQGRKTMRRLRESRPSQWRFYAGELARRAIGGRHAPLYGPRLAGLQTIVDELGHLHASAVQWQACVERSTSFGRAIEPDRYLEVKLETLDDAAIDRIVEFCDLRADPSVAERFRKVFDRDLACGQAALTDDERRRIAPFVEPVNAWIGYGT